jgi:NTE family protein
MIFFKNKKVGLVLGGGGVRGFFHMGLMAGLQEQKIEIDEITGTSIGAIVGLIYASDPENDFRKITKEMDFFKLMKTLVGGMGKNSEKEIESFLKNYIRVENFEDLKIKTRINATDINEKKEIIFDQGKIFPAVIASMSVPGVFPPLKYQGKYLVDGGISNNIPIDLIEGPDKIIVSDISGPIKKVDEKSISTDILYSAFAVMQQNMSWERAKKMKNKKIIRIDLNDDKTFILDFRKNNWEYLFEMGYDSVSDIKNKL